MEHWEYEFAALGQDLLDYLAQNKHQGAAITKELTERFRQIKSGVRHKNTDGMNSPLMDGTLFNKDGYHMTQSAAHTQYQESPTDVVFQVKGGGDVRVEKAVFDAALFAAGVGTPVQVPYSRPMPADPQARKELVDKMEQEQINRSADLAGRSTYNLRLQGRRVAWEWVEFAGKAIIIGMVLVGTLWVVNKIWRGAQDGPMPEVN